MQLSRRRHRGFTLIEIMIVVSVIALLAVIAVPSFLRARKRAEATHVSPEVSSRGRRSTPRDLPGLVDCSSD